MRLVTRGDLDGLVSAVLITTMEEIDSIALIHPQDITDKKFEITDSDILTNLPYHPKAALWFDHHQLTDSNEKPPADFRGRHAIEPSVARVVYDYYSSEKLKRFEHLVSETDRFDSAQLEITEVTDPKGEILIGFTIDSRSGIGSFKDYFMKLVDWFKTMSVDEILQQPEVAERIRLMRENNTAFLADLKAHSKKDGNVVITDFRSLDRLPVGNRFLIYTLFPDTNVSVRMQWGPQKKFVAVTVGHNLFNRTSKANCGMICSAFGGGGHKGAGGCILASDKAEAQIAEIISLLKDAG
ncbi:MAG: exopolyphosphatase [Nitrospirae bacterium]|nr:MAG: exopolyphosphatase [Nitrospirota bacterium]